MKNLIALLEPLANRYCCILFDEGTELIKVTAKTEVTALQKGIRYAATNKMQVIKVTKDRKEITQGKKKVLINPGIIFHARVMSRIHAEVLGGYSLKNLVWEESALRLDYAYKLQVITQQLKLAEIAPLTTCTAVRLKTMHEFFTSAN